MVRSQRPCHSTDTAILSPLARVKMSRQSAALTWPKATPFCGRHFVPKQGLKKGVAEEAEVSSVARLHGSRFAADPARTRRRGRRPRRQGARK
jgi:hypothetical protein